MSDLLERPLRVRHTNPIRLLQVRQASNLTPRLRRILLAGPELAGFASAAADDHVKLFLPHPGQDRPTLPQPGPNGPVFAEGVRRPTARDYTPRRFDPAAGELTIDFVLHGDGPASLWAAQAVPGQSVGIGGPRGSFLAPDDAACVVLMGDETALPAIGRRLEELPPGAPAIVAIEVADEREEMWLPTAGNATVTWLHRNGTPPGQPALLASWLHALDLPGGDPHVWMAGEISVIRALRTVLVTERGVPKSRVRAAGYWRHGEPGAHGRIDD